MSDLPSVCPWCGAPRDLDSGDDVEFLCGTWMVGGEPMQYDRCKLTCANQQIATLTGTLEEITKYCERFADPAWNSHFQIPTANILTIINRKAGQP